MTESKKKKSSNFIYFECDVGNTNKSCRYNQDETFIVGIYLDFIAFWQVTGV
jgi:hypothetical protein